MAAFEVTVTEEKDVSVVAPSGRLDTKTSHQLEKTVTGLLGTGKRRFVLDLSGLEYLSSAGLRVLLMLGKRLGGDQGYLALCGLNPTVREVFEIAGFTALFTIFPARAQALAAAPAPGSANDALLEAAARQLGVAAAPPPVPAKAGSALEELAARAVRALGIEAGGVAPPARENSGVWYRT